ncbi:MAG: hypothetical protein U0M99_05050 [Oscillospiraceae bacterium]|nr:hypothetical protein [Oscillibacter sp.]
MLQLERSVAMTYECAAYFRLLLLCGYKDELQQYVEKALLEQDPLSDVVLELSLSGSNDKKMLSVLNEYLRQVKDSDIDYDNTVFEQIISFLRKRYYDDAMPIRKIAQLMHRLALYTDRYLAEPWFTLYWMDDLFSEAEAGYLHIEDCRDEVEECINSGSRCTDHGSHESRSNG